jgi:hypothetical protein
MQALFATLELRFTNNMRRHKTVAWPDVASRLVECPVAVWSLAEMERTGGEPDVIGYDKKTSEYIFCDCAPESPVGRRSVCYDQAGRESRADHPPADTALDMAAAMGVQLLSPDEYRALQKLGVFDLKTSSWLMTPLAIRERGGALFGDRRYDAVFVYHNGAQSYYAARGFRASLRV